MRSVRRSGGTYPTRLLRCPISTSTPQGSSWPAVKVTAWSNPVPRWVLTRSREVVLPVRCKPGIQDGNVHAVAGRADHLHVDDVRAPGGVPVHRRGGKEGAGGKPSSPRSTAAPVLQSLRSSSCAWHSPPDLTTEARFPVSAPGRSRPGRDRIPWMFYSLFRSAPHSFGTQSSSPGLAAAGSDDPPKSLRTGREVAE
jgi:hypothetical protein